MIKSAGSGGARSIWAKLGLNMRRLVCSLCGVIVEEVWVNELVHLLDLILLCFLIIVHGQISHHPISWIGDIQELILFLIPFRWYVGPSIITNWISRAQRLCYPARIVIPFLDSLIVGVTTLELCYVAVVWKSFAHEVRLGFWCCVNIILCTFLIISRIFLAAHVLSLTHQRALSRGFLEVVSCILGFI